MTKQSQSIVQQDMVRRLKHLDKALTRVIRENQKLINYLIHSRYTYITPEIPIKPKASKM